MELDNIYNEDCLEGMKRIPDGTIDAVICDLPYGTMKDSWKGLDEYDPTKHSWDSIIPTDQLFLAYGRVLRPGGVAVLFSQEPYTSHLRTFKAYNAMKFCYPMIWKKDSAGNSLMAKKAPMSYFEDINVFSRSNPLKHEVDWEHPLRPYFAKVLEFIGRPKSEIMDALGSRVDHTFRCNSTQFSLCTAETYADIIERYGIDKMEGFMSYEELAAIDEPREMAAIEKEHESVFNLPDGKQSMSNVLEFSKDTDDLTSYQCPDIRKGGTGYDIKSRLPDEIDQWRRPDYSLYPQHPFSIQFYSRGCIRHCPFCLVHDKEGKIHPVEPMELNPNGQWIEVLDNNFFANPEWREAVDHLRKCNQPVKFHGVDVRIMDEEQAYALNSLRLKNGVHIAWDLPQIDLTDRLEAMTKYIKAYKIVCYVLVGFNSTREQDLFRLRTLKRLGIYPFVQAFRDYENQRKPSQYEKDIARWANRAWLFKAMDFLDFEPRKGFKCKEYFE